MFVGPVFTRAVVTSPRRSRFFLARTIYVTLLFGLICTAWLVLAGTQIIRNVGDMARFGAMLFPILALLQLAVIFFFSAMATASAVAQEKDRRTMLLLLLTRLTNSELVLGKLLASLLNVLGMVAAAAPVFMLVVLLGGVSFAQVGRVLAVTVATALAAGSLGSTIALWREKTFQTLAVTALALIFWLGIWEAVHAGLLGSQIGPFHCRDLASIMSPFRAVWAAARPLYQPLPPIASALGQPDLMIHYVVVLHTAMALLATLLLNAVAIARVRQWNSSPEVRRVTREAEGLATIWSADQSTEQQSAVAESAREGHVDARLREQKQAGATRSVWDNPVLWREVCTWAYGRKVLLIRLAYLVITAMAGLGVYQAVAMNTAADSTGAASIPAAAGPLALYLLISWVIVNALAVTSITTERDGRSLDLLLVTDLSPKEFLFGKLGGVFYVAKEMVVLPLAMCVALYFAGGISLENLLYTLVGLAVMFLFVSMLGIHCGMIYENSRTAISLSLGTVFFLFLGVAAIILMMISFSGSFQVQLAPFSVFILGGGVGLYVTLGGQTPSRAILAASLILPFATFYAITSFLLHYDLPVFLVTAASYGFTTLAMMMPALFEYRIAGSRVSEGG